MIPEQELVELITKKYPGLETRVEQLFEHNDDFRSLCADYYFCLRDLYKYKKLSELEKQSIREYESVIGDLEKEMIDFLFAGK